MIALKPEGYLSVGALLGKAEAKELAGDHGAAADLYERASCSEGAGARRRAGASRRGRRWRPAIGGAPPNAFLRVYYEFPLSEAATSAAAALRLAAGPDRSQQLQARPRTRADSLRRPSLRRCAQRASRISAARSSGDDRELADLRIAESDFFLKRYAAARDALQPHLEHASRRAEARFFYLSAIRELGDARSNTSR